MIPQGNQLSLGLAQSQKQQQGQKMEQVQKLSQRQLLGVQILQKTTAELRDELRQALTVNPFLEQVAPSREVLDSDMAPPSPAEGERVLQAMDGDGKEYAENLLVDGTERLPDTPPTGEPRNLTEFGRDLERGEGYTWDPDSEERRQYRFDSYHGEASFLEELQRACRETVDVSGRLMDLCLMLCEAITEDGYLEGTDEELWKALDRQKRCSLEEVRQAIQALQEQMEPAGIGARDLRECLLIQLRRKGEEGSLEWKLVNGHFQELEQAQREPEAEERIALQEGCGREEVEEALERLRALSPRPARRLSPEVAVPVEPDAFVERDASGNWTVRVNREALPSLVLSDEYLGMLEEETRKKGGRSARKPRAGEEESVVKYLEKKKSDAEALLEGVENRWNTVERVAGEIVKRQSAFFQNGDVHEIRPLRQKDLVEAFGKAASTISRAVQGKCMSTPWGFMKFSDFFSKGGVSQGEGENKTAVSEEKVISYIRELVGREKPENPLSDEEVTQRLNGQYGLKIERRTVTKYRIKAGIGSSRERKRKA